MPDESRKPFHQQLANQLIEQLRQGTAPWQQPWQPGAPQSLLPVNPTTGKRYKGINAIQLLAQGRSDQRWMTYRQARAAAAQVQAGARGTLIQYWAFTEEQTKTDAHGRPVLDALGEPAKEVVRLERPRVFSATVFNAEQIDGLPASARKERDQMWSAVERAEVILRASGAVIRHSEQNRAFYGLATDSSELPNKSQFLTADNYYATALHELGHWTGHASRLNRDYLEVTLLRDSKRFPNTGGWDTRSSTMTPRPTFTADAATADCGHTWHQAVKNKDYIFHPYQTR